MAEVPREGAPIDAAAPAVDPLDEVRVMADPADPDVVLVWLPEFTRLDTVAWSMEVGIPRSLIPGLCVALNAELAAKEA